MTIKTLELALAKQAFQIHGVDKRDHVVLSKQVTIPASSCDSRDRMITATALVGTIGDAHAFKSSKQ